MRLDETLKRIKKYTKLVAKDGYRPWLKVTNVAKLSRRTVTLGMKTNRLHHLLSDGESNLFYIEEAKLFTTNIFEQFPLLDVTRCIDIAKDLGCRYPTDKEGNAIVMSTDLLVEQLNPERREQQLVAYTFKYRDHLFNNGQNTRSVNRNLEKLAIEKIYWNQQGVDYIVRDEVSAPAIKARNLAWARAACLYRQRFDKVIDPFVTTLLEHYLDAPRTRINTLIEMSAVRCELDWDSAFVAFQYAVWANHLPIDHRFAINPRNSLRLLTAAQMEIGGND